MQCQCDHCRAMREIDKIVDQTGLDPFPRIADYSVAPRVLSMTVTKVDIAYPPFSKEG